MNVLGFHLQNSAQVFLSFWAPSLRREAIEHAALTNQGRRFDGDVWMACFLIQFLMPIVRKSIMEEKIVIAGGTRLELYNSKSFVY